MAAKKKKLDKKLDLSKIVVQPEEIGGLGEYMKTPIELEMVDEVWTVASTPASTLYLRGSHPETGSKRIETLPPEIQDRLRKSFDRFLRAPKNAESLLLKNEAILQLIDAATATIVSRKKPTPEGVRVYFPGYKGEYASGAKLQKMLKLPWDSEMNRFVSWDETIRIEGTIAGSDAVAVVAANAPTEPGYHAIVSLSQVASDLDTADEVRGLKLFVGWTDHRLPAVSYQKHTRFDEGYLAKGDWYVIKFGGRSDIVAITDREPEGIRPTNEDQSWFDRAFSLASQPRSDTFSNPSQEDIDEIVSRTVMLDRRSSTKTREKGDGLFVRWMGCKMEANTALAIVHRRYQDSADQASLQIDAVRGILPGGQTISPTPMTRVRGKLRDGSQVVFLVMKEPPVSTDAIVDVVKAQTHMGSQHEIDDYLPAIRQKKESKKLYELLAENVCSPSIAPLGNYTPYRQVLKGLPMTIAYGGSRLIALEGLVPGTGFTQDNEVTYSTGEKALSIALEGVGPERPFVVRDWLDAAEKALAKSKDDEGAGIIAAGPIAIGASMIEDVMRLPWQGEITCAFPRTKVEEGKEVGLAPFVLRGVVGGMKATYLQMPVRMDKIGQGTPVRGYESLTSTDWPAGHRSIKEIARRVAAPDVAEAGKEIARGEAAPDVAKAGKESFLDIVARIDAKMNEWKRRQEPGQDALTLERNQAIRLVTLWREVVAGKQLADDETFRKVSAGLAMASAKLADVEKRIRSVADAAKRETEQKQRAQEQVQAFEQELQASVDKVVAEAGSDSLDDLRRVRDVHKDVVRRVDEFKKEVEARGEGSATFTSLVGQMRASWWSQLDKVQREVDEKEEELDEQQKKADQEREIAEIVTILAAKASARFMRDTSGEVLRTDDVVVDLDSVQDAAAGDYASARIVWSSENVSDMGHIVLTTRQGTSAEGLPLSRMDVAAMVVLMIPTGESAERDFWAVPRGFYIEVKGPTPLGVATVSVSLLSEEKEGSRSEKARIPDAVYRFYADVARGSRLVDDKEGGLIGQIMKLFTSDYLDSSCHETRAKDLPTISTATPFLWGTSVDRGGGYDEDVRYASGTRPDIVVDAQYDGGQGYTEPVDELDARYAVYIDHGQGLYETVGVLENQEGIDEKLRDIIEIAKTQAFTLPLPFGEETIRPTIVRHTKPQAPAPAPAPAPGPSAGMLATEEEMRKQIAIGLEEVRSMGEARSTDKWAHQARKAAASYDEQAEKVRPENAAVWRRMAEHAREMAAQADALAASQKTARRTELAQKRAEEAALVPEVATDDEEARIAAMLDRKRAEKVLYADDLRARAARLRAEAEAIETRNQKLGEVMMGTPVLVGHHSEKRHRRDLDKIHASEGKRFELLEEAKRLEGRAAQVEKVDAPIKSTDPDAVDLLKHRIRLLRARQAEWQRDVDVVKSIFRQVKKPEDRKKAVEAREDVSSEMRRALDHFTNHYKRAPRLESASFYQAIRSAQERLQAIVAKAAKGPRPMERYGQIEVFEDDGRVQIKLPSRADSATYAKLKSRGFKWSPTRGTFVRQASDGAWYAAQEIARQSSGVSVPVLVTPEGAPAAEGLDIPELSPEMQPEDEPEPEDEETLPPEAEESTMADMRRLTQEERTRLDAFDRQHGLPTLLGYVPIIEAARLKREEAWAAMQDAKARGDDALAGRLEQYIRKSTRSGAWVDKFDIALGRELTREELAAGRKPGGPAMAAPSGPSPEEIAREREAREAAERARIAREESERAAEEARIAEEKLRQEREAAMRARGAGFAAFQAYSGPLVAKAQQEAREAAERAERERQAAAQARLQAERQAAARRPVPEPSWGTMGDEPAPPRPAAPQGPAKRRYALPVGTVAPIRPSYVSREGTDTVIHVGDGEPAVKKGAPSGLFGAARFEKREGDNVVIFPHGRDSGADVRIVSSVMPLRVAFEGPKPGGMFQAYLVAGFRFEGEKQVPNDLKLDRTPDPVKDGIDMVARLVAESEQLTIETPSSYCLGTISSGFAVGDVAVIVHPARTGQRGVVSLQRPDRHIELVWDAQGPRVSGYSVRTQRGDIRRSLVQTITVKDWRELPEAVSAVVTILAGRLGEGA